MSAPTYIDFFIDPDTGEMEIKIEGLADEVCAKKPRCSRRCKESRYAGC